MQTALIDCVVMGELPLNPMDNGALSKLLGQACPKCPRKYLGEQYCIYLHIGLACKLLVHSSRHSYSTNILIVQIPILHALLHI